VFDQWKFLQNPKYSTRVELAEMITGLLLVLFMWGHLIMLSTILFGEETMNSLAQFLESAYLAQLGAAGIVVLVLLHFFTAGRKLPGRIKEQLLFMKLAKQLKHLDTWLWFVQVVSGMAILIFASIHLWYIATTFPIAADKSSIRVAEALGWLYAPMVLVVELHVGVGLYRIFVKWTSFNRKVGSAIKWVMTIGFVVVGYLILGAFWANGLKHLN
jgi:fumarate reductase subunit C